MQIEYSGDGVRRGAREGRAEPVRRCIARSRDMPQAAWARLDEASRIDMGYPKQWMDIVVPATFSGPES